MTQHYTIRVKGHLDLAWSEWLGDLTMVHQASGETLLSGPIVDQAALYGLLMRLRDLGLVLLTVDLTPQCQPPPDP